MINQEAEAGHKLTEEVESAEARPTNRTLESVDKSGENTIVENTEKSITNDKRAEEPTEQIKITQYTVHLNL